MKTIRINLERLLSWIDNGSFFISPMKWIYMVFAYLSFIPPFILVYFIFELSDEGLFKYMSGWSKFTAYLFCLIFLAVVVIAAIIMYFFWKNRCKKINQAVRVGDQMGSPESEPGRVAGRIYRHRSVNRRHTFVYMGTAYGV